MILLSFLFFTLLISGIRANGLTVAEIGKFGSSGNYNDRVSVDQSHSEYASGTPDHPWEVVNPNTPTNQNYNIKIPKTPTEATTKACVPFGKIGLTRTGVAIYNPLASSSVNAVEGDNAETFDSCDGHASPDGAYHYHKIPDSCLYKNEMDEFIGVAFDGYPIYGPNASDVQGRWLTSDDLDKCHGRTVNGEYRYHVTEQFPYFLGCYHGTVYEDVVNVAYDCNLTNNAWGPWTYYLCACPEIKPSGSGEPNPGNSMSPPECHPSYPTRPPYCHHMPSNTVQDVRNAAALLSGHIYLVFMIFKICSFVILS